MKDFRIKVTPKESELVQELLFLCGYSWRDGDRNVTLTIMPYLELEDNNLYYSNSESPYKNDRSLTTFDEFLDMIEIELEKKQIE